MITSSSDKVSRCVDNYNIIKGSKCKKLLGIKIDNKLNFISHINEVWKKVEQKLNAVSRVTPFMDLPKRRMLFILFVIHCPLVCMFHSHRKNNKINRLHERC